MKKKHFYEGMKPSPSDFDVLQQNTEDAVNAATHAITGAGVLTGLEVSMSGNTVTVTRGKAICNNGQMVELLADTTVPRTNGLVVLRRSVTDLSTAVDIRQNTVWEERGDTTTLHFVGSAGSHEELVILGGVSGSGYYDTHRQIARGWDTVAALRQQMKQELTTKIEQVKTELTSAVAQARSDADTASRVLRRDMGSNVTTINSSISSARSDATTAINTAKTEAINAALPVGFIYVQFPAQKTPAQLSWPGTWQNISHTYKGCFFRAESSRGVSVAKPFTNTAYPGHPDDDPRAPQPDAGRNVEGRFGYLGHNVDSGNPFGTEAFTRHSAGVGGWGEGESHSGFGAFKISIDARYSWGSAHTASEFRPINYTIRIWKRIS